MEDFDSYEMMDYGIEEYDKRPCYRNRRGSYFPVYRMRDRVGHIERGIGPFIKLMIAVTVFLVLVGVIA